MIHFIYTYTKRDIKHAGTWTCHKTVEIYKVTRNVPKRVARLTETFVSEFQLFMRCAEVNKLMPKKAFERTKCASFAHNAMELQTMGIATITRV
jgi:hypothetical protein